MTCFTPSVSSSARLAGLPARGDDFRAEMMRDLDRRHADAARARVDEDALALAQARHVLQRVPRGHEDHRQRRRFLERQVVRNAAHVAAARQRLRREAEDRETEDAIARRDMRDAGTDRLDHAADFVAEDARIGRFAGIERERLEHVAEVHARGFHFDEHFAGPQGGRANGAKRSVSRCPRSRDSRRSGTAGSSVCSMAGRPRSRRCT